MSVRAIGMAFALSLAAGVGAIAQQLKLEDLVREALQRNPEILAAQKSYEAARQRPSQVASLPDPVLSPAWNSNGNPLPGAGIGREATSNIGFTVTQTMPYPGKQRLRGDVARKEAEAQFADFELTELSVVSKVKQAYFRLQHSASERSVLDRGREFLTSLLQVTEARYTAGKAAQQDVFKAQTQVSLVETRLLQNDRERRLRQAEINSLLNRPAGSPLGQPQEPHVAPMLRNLEELQSAARKDSPARMRDQKLTERAEVAMNLARKDYYPDYAFTGGYFNMGGLPPFYTFRVDVTIPLYFRSKQRAAVTEQAEMLSQARHGYQATGQSLDLRIADDYLSAETSERLMGLYLDTVIPQARLAADSSMSSYETGSLDFLSILNNYNAVLEYEMNYHEEMLNYHLALSRLEEATGLKLIDEEGHEVHNQ
jgi:cobalt-zinc-cadmium efflux system outer membrane protein